MAVGLPSKGAWYSPRHVLRVPVLVGSGSLFLGLLDEAVRELVGDAVSCIGD